MLGFELISLRQAGLRRKCCNQMQGLPPTVSHVHPKCLLCLAPVESPEHILVLCTATSEIRQRLFPELVNVVSDVQPSCSILSNNTFTSSELTQFLLDCTSLNLKESIRIPLHNPGIGKIFRLSHDWCFAVSNCRSRLLAAQNKKKNS